MSTNNTDAFPEAPRILLLAGLHGSGKTTFIKKQKEQTDFVCFDDFMDNALNHEGYFRNCRYRAAIHEVLKLRKNLILGDARLCEPAFREELLADLAGLLEPYTLFWHCFVPDYAACLHNILYREQSIKSGNLQTEKTNNRRLCRLYTYPPGSTIHPVTRANLSPGGSGRLKLGLADLLVQIKTHPLSIGLSTILDRSKLRSMKFLGLLFFQEGGFAE